MKGNRMGPREQGPKTGRGMGFCRGNDRPGYENEGRGFGPCGQGHAFGRGRGRGAGQGLNRSRIRNGDAQ